MLALLSMVHFAQKTALQNMIAVYYLLACEGGPIQPGDDMQDSQFR